MYKSYFREILESRISAGTTSLTTHTPIARVTASNLSRLTSSTNIQPVANFATLDYTTLLEINIAQFEPDDDNQMILQGTWKKQPVTGKQTSAHFFKIFIPIPVNDSPMSARVISMNQALEQLARQIVRQP